MIKVEDFHVFNYVKKEEYTGSMSGMRYMLKKSQREQTKEELEATPLAEGENPKPVTCLEVIIWPEPNCYAKTPEELKQRKLFSFSVQGVEDAANWLNEQYVEQKELWTMR